MIRGIEMCESSKWSKKAWLHYFFLKEGTIFNFRNCGYLRSLNVIGCTAEQGEIVLKDALRQTKVWI